MARIIKRKDEYFVEFYGNGLRFEKYAGKDEEKARELLKEIETSLPNGAMSNVIPDQDIDHFFDEFLREAKNTYALSTYQYLQSVLGQFSLFLKHTSKLDQKKLSVVTPQVMEQFLGYLSEKNKSATDANFQFFLMSCVLDYALKKGYLNDNPSLHIPFLKDGVRLETFGMDELKEFDLNATGAEKKVSEYLLGAELPGSELKSVCWADLHNHKLRNSFVQVLLIKKVPLFKIFEILKIEDIEQLKALISLIPRRQDLS